MSRTALAALSAFVLLVGADLAGADPLRENLELLRARAAASRPSASRPAPPSRSRPARRPSRRTRVVRPAEPETPAADRFVTYTGERFGSRSRTGDLVVRTRGADGVTHVYVRQRLLSQEGNGLARVPDLAPGRHPIMVWAPEARKRRTFWITIRPGHVAQLDAAL